jgi:GWxTD domain-containing protein
MPPLLLVVYLITDPAGWQGRVDSLLTAGDTSAAISELRSRVKTEPTPRVQCRLATLLTKRARADRSEDLDDRSEAQGLFESSVRHEPRAECLLAYAELRQKQHMSVEAGRLASRAFDLLQRQPDQLTPTMRADFYYERARPIANWVRNYEHLVSVPDLAVSTPDCDAKGPFCDAFAHPANFAEKLERGTHLDGLVDGQRRVMTTLLDSALALDPAHPSALRLALREAIVVDDWRRFAALAAAAHRRDSLAASPMLYVLAGLVHDQRWVDASRTFDTITTRLGPEATAMFEGLALVADSSVRDRLHGQQRVVYGEAVWGMSDPLYLTPYNERRLTHYARVTLADVLLTDPATGTPGRDSDQGRLVIRYGMPEKWFELSADRSRELTAEDRAELDAMTSCASRAGPIGPAGPIPATCSGMTSTAPQGGGRWSFWYYAHQPPLIFERSLGYWTGHHMQFTLSRTLDSLMYRAKPTTFESPYPNATIHALVTRFPRGQLPWLEVHARAEWAASDLTSEAADVGIFLHDPATGREITRSVGRAQVRESAASFGGSMEVPWGRLRLAIEGKASATTAAGQLRDTVTIDARPPGQLVLSDILLGDSATAPATFQQRDDVRFWPRSDSVYAPGAPIALYWETYGFGGDTAGRQVNYRVKVWLEDAGGRLVTATLWRGATAALGLRQTDERSVEWESTRPLKGAVLPELLLLTAPNDDGRYRINVEVTDLASGKAATTRRVISLK